MGEGAKQATGITILSLVLAAAAMAAGAGDAGMGIMAAGQQAAMGSFLAFTRAQESSADLAGAKYLSAAGVSGKGSLEFFKKLQNQEYRLAIYAKDSYDRTHPLSGERIASLQTLYQKDPAWNRDAGSRARSALPAGQGQADRLCRPQARGHALSRKRPKRPGPLCPRLRLSSRRLSRQSAARGGRPARRRARRPVLPGTEGPDPSRIGQAGRGARCRSAPRSSRRPTSR